ncbi:MAG TPA: PrsW family glutamic-type intramembrane protease [Ktedonobacteraceae bacterium]|jgi:RsiW-degrading membrane proteinase PrsW (M82 family)/pSer/pThr/pTyr-binding forkhead associated (FHA) protein|nr:PrsW family glutamic-type intramembrane protease [Ktedonobacteraceae bacterium]
MNQNYGVLRVVRVMSARSSSGMPDAQHSQAKHPTGWLPEEGLVHVLTRRTTAIGRALHNDVILMDPTVSREHARLILDQSGWHIVNLTEQNVVRVNGRPVPGGRSLRVQTQDIIVLGNTMLQLIAPSTSRLAVSGAGADSYLDSKTDILPRPQLSYPAPSGSMTLEKERPLLTSSMPLQQEPATAWRQDPAPFDTRDRARSLDENHARAFTPPNLSTVPERSDAQAEQQVWEDEEAESILGAGITMQFALPQRMGIRTRWLIAGIGLAILLTSAMITVILNSVIGLSALEQNGVASIIAALTIPIIPAIGIFLLVNFMDRYEREPWFLRLAAFLWGAIIAIPPAFFIEQKVDPLLQNLLNQVSSSEVLHTALQELNVGVTEETIKGLGLLLLFIILRDEFDNVTDGIVYGALIGAGFAMVENFSYFALNSKNFLVFLIVGRIILGWLGHSTFIACFGAALGYVRHTRVRWKQILIPLLGFLVAVGLHSFFDFVDFQASAAIRSAPYDSTVVTYALIAIIGNYIPPFLAQLGLLYILIKSLAHEAAIIREFLASEVSDGVVTVGEYALLQNSFNRTKEERRVMWKCGMRQWMRVKALYQTEIGLAFRKWHVHMGDKPKLGYIQPEDAYRRRIRNLRNEIRAAGCVLEMPPA